jgi:hypothetical protein
MLGTFKAADPFRGAHNPDRLECNHIENGDDGDE